MTIILENKKETSPSNNFQSKIIRLDRRSHLNKSCDQMADLRIKPKKTKTLGGKMFINATSYIDKTCDKRLIPAI